MLILAMWAVAMKVGITYYFRHGSVGVGLSQVSLQLRERTPEQWASAVQKRRDRMLRSGGVEIPGPSSVLERIYLYEHWTVCKDKEATIGITRLPTYRHRIYSFSMPFWCLLTLAAIPTAVLWHRDRRTVKPGCCLTCGYDLRASKKTCPECGTDVATGEPLIRKGAKR